MEKKIIPRDRLFEYEVCYKMTPCGVIRRKTVTAHSAKEAYDIVMATQHPTYGRPPFSAWAEGIYYQNGKYEKLRHTDADHPFMKYQKEGVKYL